MALSTKHVLGAGSIEFDKVDGLANSGIGGITKALTAIDLSGSSPHDILQTVVQVGATSELDGGSAYFFLRLGTNSTDYNEWRIDGTEFTAGIWETVALEIGDASFAGQGGDGITWTAITYIAVGFSFDAVGDTLANIYVDEISFHTNQHVNAAINAEISSSVTSANVNVQKIAGSPTTKGAGNAGNGSQRIVLATDDINMAAINAAVVGSISGSGSPSVDSYSTAAVNVATGANSELVGTPGANKQIWVYGLVLSANVAGTFSLQDDVDAALSGVMTIALAGGFVMNPSGNFAMPWIKVATNKALEIDCVACTADGIITYAIVSV